MNYGDHQQQQYLMQQGQRIQNPRMMPVPANMAMQRQQRYSMAMIQPGQQPMQIGPNQYVQAAQMQPRAPISINDALSRLPPEVQQVAQQQINAEPNPERKKQIALNIIQTHRMRIPQSYQNSGPMSGSAVMVNMGGSQQVGMTSGNISGGQIIRMSTSQGGPMPQGPIYSAQGPVMQGGMTQMPSGQVAMQRVASHAYLQSGVPTAGHMLQQFPTSQEQQPASGATLPNYNSPQSLVIQQPSSVGPSMQQSTLQQKGPNSVPSAVYQHHPHDGMTSSQNMANNEAEKTSEEPLYSQKLEQLKAYQDQIRRIIERNRLDGQQPKPKYERLIEIMESRRKVDLNLMEKLIVSVKSTVERSSVCYPLLEIMRTDPCNLLADAFKASAPDPWADFRQYSIKVPDEVLSLTRESSSSSPQKRHASLGGPASKRIKKEDVPPVAVSADFHSEKMLPIPEKRVVVECKDGSQIELSQEASEQLSSARFRFDTDILPISSECVEVQVLIENDSVSELHFSFIAHIRP